MFDAIVRLRHIWQTLFAINPDFYLMDFQKQFCADLSLPILIKNHWNEDLVAASRPFNRIVSQDEIQNSFEVFQETPAGEVKHVSTLLPEIYSNLIFSGSNCYDSSEITDSDNIYKSMNVHYSRGIHQSQNVIFCCHSTGLDNAAACDNSAYSEYVIRAIDSINCSRCFDVYQSAKCSNCFFLGNCYDVHESILCTNLRSKRFCIGNKQFSEDQYQQLKIPILEELVFRKFRPMYDLGF